jgi:hypothetical protein
MNKTHRLLGAYLAAGPRLAEAGGEQQLKGADREGFRIGHRVAASAGRMRAEKLEGRR